MRLLELFCGMGGLACGFAREGFNITGVDINDKALETFKFNGLGAVLKKDLSKEYIGGDFDIITGGPPCKPWSSLNLRKRGESHSDVVLLDRFFEHILTLKPRIFIFENVPPVMGYENLIRWLRRIEKEYSLMGKVVAYSGWGASTGRERFFLTGILRRYGKAYRLWEAIEKKRRRPMTVREAIGWLEDKEENSFPDHEWANFKTIDKYIHKYREGRYGWYVLSWDKPAPSFGNIMKTYILHPSQPRVISVREALSIMGFPPEFRFPEGMGLSQRYQMIADTVSPIFSRILAQSIKEVLY